MSDNTLVLHPYDLFANLDDIETFVSDLNNIGLLGHKYDWHGEKHYQAGSKFHELVSFLTDHTAIVLGNKGKGLVEINRVPNRDVCHLYISSVKPQPEFLFSGITTLHPACPLCGYKTNLNTHLNVIEQWYVDRANFRWACPECNRIAAIYEMDWEQTAGFARYSIDIWNIHMGEAVPSKDLLDMLQNITGGQWTYFYFRF